jgi:hypothetical protein
LTFSVGMNMPGYTFCRYHLKGLQFSLFLKLRRSVRSPMSRSWWGNTTLECSQEKYVQNVILGLGNIRKG